MEIEIYFSNSLEKLASTLSDEILNEQKQTERHPFKPHRVIVPNPNVKKWLQLRIADRTDISINIEFYFLEEGLWAILQEIESNPEIEKCLLKPFQLQMMIFAWILREEDRMIELEALHDYLRPGTSNDQDSMLKTWQLSEKLAMLFREYEYHRKEYMQAWFQDQRNHYGSSYSAYIKKIETCQRKIFYEIFKTNGFRDIFSARFGIKFLSLFQYASEVFSNRSHSRFTELRPKWHIFGLSHFSPFHCEVLFSVASCKETTFNLYQLNVCREYWEDVTTPAEDRYFLNWQRIKNTKGRKCDTGEELEDMAFENSLLKSWGKPGRETLKILSDLEERYSEHVNLASYWLDDDQIDRDPRTSLYTIQDRILHRTEETHPLKSDTSLQIAGCPGIFREVETVYNSIIWNMDQDSSLHLSDIVVLVPAIEKYKPVIKHVFESGGQIPYNLVDTNASIDSVFGNAIIALLDLAKGDFTRSQIFTLLNNPCFQAGISITREDTERWLHWTVHLNIFRGFSSTQEQLENPDTIGKPFTWQRGLQRLRFGRIMTPPEGDQFFDFMSIVPFADMESNDPKKLGSFCSVIEMLFQDLGALKEKQLSFHDWKESITLLVNRYLSIPDDLPNERFVEHKFRNELKNLDMLDEMIADKPITMRIDLETIKAIIISRLTAIRTGQGSYLSGGVTIASLQPMRPIPFDVIYILGLEEGSFPGVIERSTLDLRQYHRKIGDVSQLEAHCYLFLETLIAARRKLYLSYICQDLEKYELLYPGSLLKKLLNYMSQDQDTFSHSDKSDMMVITVPIKGSSLSYLLPGVEYSDLCNFQSVNDRLLALVQLLKKKNPKLLNAEDILAIIEKRSPRFDLEPSYIRSESESTVTIEDIKTLLVNPIEGMMRKRLYVYQDLAADSLLENDELFYSTFPIKNNLPIECLEFFVHNQGDVIESDKYLEQRYLHYKNCSALPDGAYGDLDYETIMNNFHHVINGSEDIKRPLISFVQEMRKNDFLENVTFGDNSSYSLSNLQFPALKVMIETQDSTTPVSIHGSLRFLWSNKQGIWTDALVIVNNKITQKHPKEVLTAFLFYVLAVASGSFPENTGFSIHLCHEKGLISFHYPGFEHQWAKSYLKSLVSELCGSRGFFLLPLKYLEKDIEDLIKTGKVDVITDTMRLDFKEKIENKIENEKDYLYYSYHWRDVLRVIEPEVSDMAFDWAVRYCTPFFSCDVIS